MKQTKNKIFLILYFIFLALTFAPIGFGDEFDYSPILLFLITSSGFGSAALGICFFLIFIIAPTVFVIIGFKKGKTSYALNAAVPIVLISLAINFIFLADSIWYAKIFYTLVYCSLILFSILSAYNPDKNACIVPDKAMFIKSILLRCCVTLTIALGILVVIFPIGVVSIYINDAYQATKYYKTLPNEKVSDDVKNSFKLSDYKVFDSYSDTSSNELPERWQLIDEEPDKLIKKENFQTSYWTLNDKMNFIVEQWFDSWDSRTDSTFYVKTDYTVPNLEEDKISSVTAVQYDCENPYYYDYDNSVPKFSFVLSDKEFEQIQKIMPYVNAHQNVNDRNFFDDGSWLMDGNKPLSFSLEWSMAGCDELKCIKYYAVCNSDGEWYLSGKPYSIISEGKDKYIVRGARKLPSTVSKKFNEELNKLK